MRGYDYTLDLLGVRFDAEMELRALHELGEEIANYWKNNGDKKDFEKNCKKSIRKKLSYESDVKQVWKIIQEFYMEE